MIFNRIYLLFICSLLSSIVQADITFEEFKRIKRAEFTQYKVMIAEEFTAYKKIYHEEQEKHKAHISKNWNEVRVSDKKTWVEYSKDQSTRRMVNYEKGFLELSIKTGLSKQALEQKIKYEMHDWLLENKKTAFARDVVAHNVESRIKQTSKRVKTVTIAKEAMLTPLFFKKKNPAKKEVEQTVSRLIKQAKRQVSLEKGKKTLKIRIKIPSKGLRRKAMQLKPWVYLHASKQKIQPALVYAVIHTESAFNPMARSAVPAYGLMQIVPASAGKDSTAYLFGQMRLLAPSYLYDSEKNIEIGTAYLHILYYRYLRKISNPTSRLYCAISAYNTGAGNVARAFTGKTNINQAAREINQMTSEQVYRYLLKHLPHQETRDYLGRVRGRMEKVYN